MDQASDECLAGYCFVCQERAVGICAPCLAAPVYPGEPMTITFFCSTNCKKLGDPFHKKDCRQLQTRIFLNRAGQFLSLLYHGLQRLVRRAFARPASAPQKSTMAGVAHIRRAATWSFPSSSKVDFEVGSDIDMHGNPNLASDVTIWFSNLLYEGSPASPPSDSSCRSFC